MDSDIEFFDAYETIEQLHISVCLDSPEHISLFHTDTICNRGEEDRSQFLSEFKTDVSMPAKKTTLFSWTTKNLTKKANKDIKEFSGLEVIQEIPLSKEHQRNWVLVFSPDSLSLAFAGESSQILIFPVSKYNTEQSLDLLGPPDCYTGHSQSVISITWDPTSQCFLSCSVDFMVLLWKIGHTVPINQFIHNNIVTCLGFSPSDPDIFYTGSLGKIISLWSVSENKLKNTYQTQGLLTAGTYSPNGLLLALGMSNGECVIYETHNTVLTFLTQIHCKNRKGFKSSGKKVTGIEFQDDQYLLVSTNDSRIRLYNLADFRILQKYKGGTCEQYPIQATFSHNFVHVIRGSEDGKIFIWNTFKAQSKKRWIFTESNEKNGSVEYFCLVKGKSNSNAIFAPGDVVCRVQNDYIGSDSELIISHIIIVAVGGTLYVLYNQFKNIPW